MVESMGVPWVLLVSLFVSANGGLPLGIPPGEEDPLMARVAPDECLFYASWSGTQTPDAGSANHLELLLADPEIQLLLNKIDSLITEGITREAEGEGAEASFAAKEGLKWGRRLLSRPAAVFLATADIGPEGPIVEGGIVANVGDDAGELADLLTTIDEDFSRGALEQVQVGGATMYRFEPPPGAPSLTFGVKDEYFYVGVGDEAIETMLQRAETDPPAWLTELRDSLPVDRPSVVAYINSATIIERVKPFLMAGPDAEIKAAWQAFGIDSVSSIGFVCGMDKTHHVTRTLVELEGEPVGFLSAADVEPLTADDLGSIPRDATIAVAVRFDADELLAQIMAALDEVDPTIRREFEGALGEAEEEIGIRVRDDLLRSLGDVWSLYHSSGEGGLIGGFTGVVRVKDRARLAEVQSKLVAMIKATQAVEERSRRRGPMLGQIKLAGQEIYYITARDMPISPSWCLTESELILGAYPQNIKAYVTRGKQFRSLATAPQVARLFAGGTGPIKVYYQNTPELFEMAYPVVQLVGRSLIGELQREGMDIDISILPSGQSIRKHLKPDVTSVTRTEKGLEINCRQSFPGSGNAILLAIGAVTLAAPYEVQEVFDGISMNLAPSARRESESINNLKWIGLALHNYYDTYGRFPPAIATDDDGNPLLSWRVHVLPYIEQNALYDRFHLDEPWDSEHNKELIDLMPEIYTAPGSASMPGMTNYVAIRGENTVLSDTEPTRFRDITDGSSNTIMVVEASDDRAVTWTKPDDYQYDPMAPTHGLVGLRSGGFLALFADGHVMKIVESVDKESANFLFQRDDGNPIDSSEFDARRPRRARSAFSPARAIETELGPIPTESPRIIIEEPEGAAAP